MLQRLHLFHNHQKQLKRVLVSFSNTSRTLLISVFGLLLNFVLLHFKSQELLNAYVYCVTAVALLQVITNWGGKEFAIKTLSENRAQSASITSELIKSKVIVFVPVALSLVFLPISVRYIPAILTLLLLKSVGTVFESLVVVTKKFSTFLLAEIFINALFLILIFFDGNANSTPLFLSELVGLEFIRTFIFAFYFRSELNFKTNSNSSLALLKKSAPFLLVSLAGFACSRADLYALGILMNGETLNRYYILLNMVILCQVLFSSLKGSFAANLFRLNNKAFGVFVSKTLKTGLVLAVPGTLLINLLYALYFEENLPLFFSLFIYFNLASYSLTFSGVYYFTRLNQQKIILSIILIAGIFNCVLSVLLVTKLGLTGALISNTACAVFTAMAFKLLASKYKPSATTL